MADLLIQLEKNPEKIGQMTPEDLTLAYVQLRDREDEIAATKSILKSELISRLRDVMKTDGAPLAGYAVTTYPIISFKTKVEDAEKFGAIKMEKKVDTALLRKLYDAGREIPDVLVRQELRVTIIKEDDEAA
jgi:hypothetical protein